MHGEYIAVNILGGAVILLFSFIIIFHLHYAITHFTWYSKFTKALKVKFNMKKDWNPLHSIVVRGVHQKSNIENSSCAYLRETLLEKQFD